MKNFFININKKIKSKGISVIEMLVVVAVIGILLAVVLPQFSGVKNAQVLNSAAQDVVSTLNKARSQTLASLDSSEYGVHFQSDKIVLFKGTSYSSSSSNNEDVNMISPATISNINFTGSATNIYFSRLTGSPSASGTATISVGEKTKTITVSSTGIVSLN
ncbi:MAG TPA: prepilin-type N-terminal cleavage/methylation domain-containing protein [Candidatus Paceibacterota bacterium]|mgnify:CR=1 FL=1|nr:prepilin-type N-terminal cleavage/methylation domain-containing protein [Candidatus Paceibacterota bacterium]